MTSSTRREAKIPNKSPGLQTSMPRGRVDDGWIYWVCTGEGDSILHNPAVTREMSRVMLHPLDMEELDSQPSSEMINGIFLMVVKVSLPLFSFSSSNIGEGVPFYAILV